MPTVVRSLGHSTRTAEELVALLHHEEVRCLVDVRRFPGSRRLPWFAAAPLGSALADAGIGYTHVPELGGRRTPGSGQANAGWRNAAFRGYADHMASPEFAAGLERLLGCARRESTAVMCAEALWWRCHRRLVADALLVRGVAVLHVGAGARAEPHELTPFAVVEDGGVSYPAPQAELDL